jgi:SAM-dependent methyltransferase
MLMRINRRIAPGPARCYKICAALLDGRSGLEIGGPSAIFSVGGVMPLYAVVGSLDNCNFATRTVWEGRIEEGRTFTFSPYRPPGWQYITEAVDLRAVEDARYDFVLSSHTLEHVANPVKALDEWMRVLKKAGVLVLVLPHKEATFDHRRPVTSLEHLLDDHAADVDERDLTHLPEILELHDLSRDPAAGGREAFVERCHGNPDNRSMHHHVFDTDLAVRLLDLRGWQIREVEPMLPLHIIIVAQKPAAGAHVDNEAFRGADARYRRSSPFAEDRVRPALG